MPPPVSPWTFWRETLKSPKCILAPMVDASELPWRLLSRKYGAQLAYTPMLNAGIFLRDAHYRKEHMEESCKEDRPLIVQFCANDPDTLLQVAKMVEPHCDAIDLNLGCPQSIARKGHYGAFLQDEWDLISKMVQLVHKELSIPITCKVRIFEDIDKSVAYAQMLEKSGCYALTVHGRTREQKGPLTGLASWKHIQAVKAAVSIPVIANGNIQYGSDVNRCIESTGVDGVMSAEGNLTNPALFAGIQPLVWDMAKEYLDLVDRYPCPIGWARGHLFKMFYHCMTLEECLPYRDALAKGWSLAEFKEVVANIEKHFAPYVSGEKTWTPPSDDHYTAKLPFPPWKCQPYVRIPPEEHIKKMEMLSSEQKRKRENAPDGEPQSDQPSTPGGMSKKQMKKMARLAKKQKVDKPGKTCLNCRNIPGVKCAHKLCRTCCRKKCGDEDLTCEGHNITKNPRVPDEAATVTAATAQAVEA